MNNIKEMFSKIKLKRLENKRLSELVSYFSGYDPMKISIFSDIIDSKKSQSWIDEYNKNLFY